jgi:hypothetical protein
MRIFLSLLAAIITFSTTWFFIALYESQMPGVMPIVISIVLASFVYELISKDIDKANWKD